MSIGKNIKKIRKGKMTQVELAAKLGKSESMIRKYESDLVTPSVETLNKISEIFEVPVYKLIENDERIEVEKDGSPIIRLDNMNKDDRQYFLKDMNFYEGFLELESLGSLKEILTEYRAIHSYYKEHKDTRESILSLISSITKDSNNSELNSKIENLFRAITTLYNNDVSIFKSWNKVYEYQKYIIENQRERIDFMEEKIKAIRKITEPENYSNEKEGN